MRLNDQNRILTPYKAAVSEKNAESPIGKTVPRECDFGREGFPILAFLDPMNDGICRYANALTSDLCWIGGAQRQTTWHTTLERPL